MTEVVAERLRELAFNALDRAATAATDTVSTIADATQQTESESAAARARHDIAEALARSATLGDTTTPPGRNLSVAWMAAIEQLLPATVAAERATAAAAARTAAVNQRPSARRRHSDIDDLLR